MNTRPIVLIGFSGCGKTDAGRAAARELALPFADLREYVTGLCAPQIPEIGKVYAPTYYFSLISLSLSSMIPGGGIIASDPACAVMPDHRRILSSCAATILLDAPFDLLFDRIAGTARPILTAMNIDEIRALYRLRRPQYLTAADYVIDASRSLDSVVSELCTLAFEILSQ